MVSDLQNADKENFLKKKQIHMFIILFSIFCSGIPDLTVGILKMLIPLFFFEVYDNEQSNNLSPMW